jgi:hypothetical protein
MSKIAIAGIVGMALCGCVSSPANFGARHAIIDDVTDKSPYISGYCVVAVDGKPPQRAKSPTVTTIPMVMVEHGEHTITIGETTVTANFEAGKGYRIKSENGDLSVVEKVD